MTQMMDGMDTCYPGKFDEGIPKNGWLIKKMYFTGFKDGEIWVSMLNFRDV